MAHKYVEREDAEWMEVAQRWVELKNTIESLQAQEKELKEHLIRLARERSSKGGGVRLLKSLRKGVVCYDKIPELRGVDLESYRAPSTEGWVLMRVPNNDN